MTAINKLVDWYTQDWSVYIKPVLDQLSEKFGAPVRFISLGGRLDPTLDVRLQNLLEVLLYNDNNTEAIVAVTPQFNNDIIVPSEIMFEISFNARETIDLSETEWKIMELTHWQNYPETDSILFNSWNRGSAMAYPIRRLITEPYLLAQLNVCYVLAREQYEERRLNNGLF